MGLARALLQAEPLVDGDFLVLNGDDVLRADLVVSRQRRTAWMPSTLVDSAAVATRPGYLGWRTPRFRGRLGLGIVYGSWHFSHKTYRLVDGYYSLQRLVEKRITQPTSSGIQCLGSS